MTRGPRSRTENPADCAAFASTECFLPLSVGTHLFEDPCERDLLAAFRLRCQQAPSKHASRTSADPAAAGPKRHFSEPLARGPPGHSLFWCSHPCHECVRDLSVKLSLVIAVQRLAPCSQIVPVQARLFLVARCRCHSQEFHKILWDAYTGAVFIEGNPVFQLRRFSAASYMASPVAADFLPRSRAGSVVDDDLETDQAQVLRELQFLHT